MVARPPARRPGGPDRPSRLAAHAASVPGVPEAYISVDVETAGPVPASYALLAIGACLVDDPRQTFYAELRPTTLEADPAALAVSGLSLEDLASHGAPPIEALARFTAWVTEVTPPDRRPVFVAFNAPFDWMFVADYLARFGVPNPFGHAALDIKALYMGVTGEPWERTSFAAVAGRLGLEVTLPHHALEDALLQAEIFRRVLAGVPPRRRRSPRQEVSQ
ncbi:MAG: 3'-5' exonuclease [Actinobacteria bacterium]|nr:3'-5' exonuclease [Actinomycetota bacterium]